MGHYFFHRLYIHFLMLRQYDLSRRGYVSTYMPRFQISNHVRKIKFLNIFFLIESVFLSLGVEHKHQVIEGVRVQVHLRDAHIRHREIDKKRDT